ncbi:uncharacterized protein LOC100931969 isoform X1 [Sarcophilus harrisii]|uniref:uncharacterized protein LOC100931969 isoform X1 n=1 Tax=Sarcophilus harrisii TaxID=9305 RepID=UPI001301B24D|nr:uncharacterized protein LOC100931969 isoform X1 [Sarcophilus harrisii]
MTVGIFPAQCLLLILGLFPPLRPCRVTLESPFPSPLSPCLTVSSVSLGHAPNTGCPYFPASIGVPLPSPPARSPSVWQVPPARKANGGGGVWPLPPGSPAPGFRCVCVRSRDPRQVPSLEASVSSFAPGEWRGLGIHTLEALFQPLPRVSVREFGPTAVPRRRQHGHFCRLGRTPQTLVVSHTCGPLPHPRHPAHTPPEAEEASVYPSPPCGPSEPETSAGGRKEESQAPGKSPAPGPPAEENTKEEPLAGTEGLVPTSPHAGKTVTFPFIWVRENERPRWKGPRRLAPPSRGETEAQSQGLTCYRPCLLFRATSPVRI